MTSTSIKTLGFTIKVQVPSSVEEYDSAAKSTGACLESAIKNVLYRSVLASFRDQFTERLAKLTGIDRKTKETGKTKTIKGENGAADTTEAIEVWDETEGSYFDRVVATIASKDGLSNEAVIASFESLAAEVASSLVFDPSAKESVASGPKKTAKVYMDAAQEIINKGAAVAVAAKLSTILGRTVGTSQEDIANGIRDKKRAEEKNLVAELTA